MDPGSWGVSPPWTEWDQMMVDDRRREAEYYASRSGVPTRTAPVRVPQPSPEDVARATAVMEAQHAALLSHVARIPVPERLVRIAGNLPQLADPTGLFARAVPERRPFSFTAVEVA